MASCFPREALLYPYWPYLPTSAHTAGGGHAKSHRRCGESFPCLSSLSLASTFSALPSSTPCPSLTLSSTFTSCCPSLSLPPGPCPRPRPRSSSDGNSHQAPVKQSLTISHARPPSRMRGTRERSRQAIVAPPQESCRHIPLPTGGGRERASPQVSLPRSWPRGSAAPVRHRCAGPCAASRAVRTPLCAPVSCGRWRHSPRILAVS